MLNWTDDLLTGVAEIDAQHQAMFQKANEIFALKEPAKLFEAMDFLMNYVIEHFGFEESWMIRNQYPNFISHREHHTYFITEIYKLNKNLHQEGLTDANLTVLKALLVDWLISHIHEVDKQLVQNCKC